MLPQILDVTLRDGGYVNEHKFSQDEACGIIEGLQESNIEYVEVGYYRPKQVSSGKSYPSPAVCDTNYLARLNDVAKKIKLVSMVHVNQVSTKDYEILANNNISLVRLITKPDYLNEVSQHVKAIKDCGMSCSVNLIRVSELPLEAIVSYGQIAEAFGADWFYVADSNGRLFPNQVSNIVQEIAKNLTIKLGFHAHDGLSLAFANSITALNSGVQIVDASLGGMGKGGGNLITELIATFLNWQEHSSYNISRLANTTDKYLAKWVKISSIPECKNAVASILNLNIDERKQLEDASKKQGISSLELMEELLLKSIQKNFTFPETNKFTELELDDNNADLSLNNMSRNNQIHSATH